MLLACTTMASAATPAQLQDLDATVERVRAQFDVPGVAVAVVKDGQVVLERGWGVREQGKPEPVQADTLFAIASNTKAFTATSLNLLAEDGKLKMDDKVIDHLPSFRMSDPFVTGQMTIRDLLSHRSGLSLGAGDLLFWPTTSYSNAEVVERLGQVPLKGGFRESYAYDNILYAVAQQLIEHVSGMNYQQFLQTRIFDKVGMAGTRYNADHLKPGDKAAVGHAKYDFKDLRTVAPLTWSNNAGAGGIYSSAHDMARWMQVQLAEGKLADGTALFSEKSQQQMWKMITPQSIPGAERAGAGAGAGQLCRLRRRLEPERLPRAETGLAHRWLAWHGFAADPGAGREAGRGGADQPGSGRGVQRDHPERA